MKSSPYAPVLQPGVRVPTPGLKRRGMGAQGPLDRYFHTRGAEDAEFSLDMRIHPGRWHRPLACANRRDACSTSAGGPFHARWRPSRTGMKIGLHPGRCPREASGTAVKTGNRSSLCSLRLWYENGDSVVPALMPRRFSPGCVPVPQAEALGHRVTFSSSVVAQRAMRNCREIAL